MGTLMSVVASFLPGLVQKTATEWAGPCPFCGGTDRFVLWPDGGQSGRWICRQAASEICHAKYNAEKGYGYGDGIDLVKNLRHVGYREACSLLGVSTRPGTNYRSRRHSGYRPASQSHGGNVPQTQAQHQDSEKPATLFLPSEKWRYMANGLVTGAIHALKGSEDGIMNVCGRRYLDERIFDTRLVGWIEKDLYPYASAWGLEGNRIRIPRGILLASVRGGEVASIVIRRPADEVSENEPRFWEVRGGAYMLNADGKKSIGAPFMIGAAGQPVVLCESALDACLIWNQSCGTVSAVALNGAGKPRDEEVDAFIRQSKLVLIVPDNDDPGHETWHRWRSWYPQAVLEPLPKYAKDPGDLQKYRFQNLNVVEIPTVDMWLKAALEHAAGIRGVSL